MSDSELKMKKLFLILIACVVFRAHAFDAEKVTHGLVSLEKQYLYLFDRANHYKHAVKWTDTKLLPGRVYLKYDDDLHMWIYFRSTFYGKMPKPFEALRPGTVATGRIIGAELKLQRFLLTEDGTWNSTKEPEEYHAWVKSNPPELKVYRFVKDPEALQRQIAEDSKKAKAPPPSEAKTP